jgi:CspA family cold shock protein
MNGFSGKPRSPQSGSVIKARVKWFNPDKGFGFVAPNDGASDAFIHVSVLQKFGVAILPEGAEIECEVAQGVKGMQVLRILSADTSGVPLASSRPAADPGDGDSLSGAVKWFAAEKGFGFITADDGGKDIFIHKSVLRRCGIEVLSEGQRVQVTAHATPKGREATWIGLG